MASKFKHTEKAQHNEALLRPIETADTHPDWYLTVSFYAGVHWVRAFLALHGRGSGDRDRINYDDFATELRSVGIGQRIDVEPLNKAFKNLRDLSRESRYYTQTIHWYRQQMLDADKSLDAIRSFVIAHGITP